MAERQFGPYRLIRQIAVGGMAEIHLAKTKGIAGFEKYVALKMIHPNFAEDEQFIEMLVDEAKIAVQLTHGNIAQTFDLGRVGETYYITMEYVDGADLYKILRRASEHDIAIPLDVCAFIVKEIASALDHAHRKRDHNGRPLGIVHRDVSPQNVLVSYSGEVKLVDFGIAKATMKARQTAVGVIKGKYYYMSPEQARGEIIDYRSDIFSAGIVLYELITGQMLYLEEDLHKLLEMARAADIAPPSTLRKGVPPQLERIVMHALAKEKTDRYQSASDFALDLERFLHAYSPVFTSTKVSATLRQVIGEPMQVPDEPSLQIEVRSGAMSTHPLDQNEVAHAIDKDELRDENSVIFRVAELKKPAPPAPVVAKPPPRAPTPAAPAPVVKPPPAKPVSGKIPSIPRVVQPKAPAPIAPAPIAKPAPVTGPRANSPTEPMPAGVPKPRQKDEETRRLESPAPAGPDDSGLLAWDTSDEDLENIGERTLITAMPGGGSFMLDHDEAPETTLVTSAPADPRDGEESFADLADDLDDENTLSATPLRRTQDHRIEDDDDGPTVSRPSPMPAAAPKTQPRASQSAPTQPPPRRETKPRAAQPPPALAAKIQTPAVSELRKPRASRRTPPQGNVLQAIVGSSASEPMPAPRPSSHPQPPAPTAPASHVTQPHAVVPPPSYSPQNYPGYPSPQASAPTQMHVVQPPTIPENQLAYPDPGVITPPPQPAYTTDASGLPLVINTPPGTNIAAPPGVPQHLAPYLHMQGMPPEGFPQHGQPLSPGALYQLYPQNQPPPQPMTITGQMRLFEVDELPAQYKLGTGRRLFTYIVAGLLAISVAAGATFIIIRATRSTAPPTGTIKIDSVPQSADVIFDGERLIDRTPVTIPSVTPGTRHTVRIELARHIAYTDTIDVPKSGGDVALAPVLKFVTGKIVVNSRPGGAEIRINDELRGRTPTTIVDVDMDSAKKIELRLKDYQPYVQDLSWPSSGQIDLDIPLRK